MVILFVLHAYDFFRIIFVIISQIFYAFSLHMNSNYVFAVAHMSNLKEVTNKIMPCNMVGPSGKINPKDKSIHYHFFFIFWILKFRNDFFIIIYIFLTLIVEKYDHQKRKLVFLSFSFFYI